MSELKKHILAAILFAALIAIFFHDTLSGSNVFVTTGLIRSDLMGQSYPGKVFYSRRLAEKELPLWSKDVGAGYPMMAESQLGVFYPFNMLIFSVFPMPAAFNLSLIFHLFLASLSTYFLVRVGFRKSFLASGFAGLCFGLSGFFAAHLSHPNMIQVAAFFPLVLLLLKRLSKRFSWGSFFGLVAVCFCQILAGHLQILYYFQVIVGTCLFVQTVLSYQKKGLSAFAPLCFWGGSLVLAFSLSLFQILPSLEFMAHSERGDGVSFVQATDYQFPLSHLTRFVFSDRVNFTEPVRYGQTEGTISSWETYGYIGVLPLILAGIALLVRRGKGDRGNEGDRGGGEVWWVFGLGFFSFLFCLGRASPLFEILWYVVPGMKFFQHPTRLLVLVDLFLAVLAGFGVDVLFKGDRGNGGDKRRRWVGAFLVISFSFFDLYVHNRPINPVVESSWWFAAPSVVGRLTDSLDSGYRFSTLGANNYDYRLIADLDIQKQLQNLLPSNFNLVFPLSSRDSSFGINLARSKAFSEALGRGLSWSERDGRVVVGDRFTRFLGLSSVKYFLSGLELADSNLLLVDEQRFTRPLKYEVYLLAEKGEPRVLETESFGVLLYENLEVSPRACWVKDMVWVESGETALQMLQDGDFDPRTTVVLEFPQEEPARFPNLRGWAFRNLEGFSSGGLGRAADGEDRTDSTDRTNRSDGTNDAIDNQQPFAEIIVDQDQKVVIEVSAPQDGGYLVLSDTYYPGWKAYMNKSPNSPEPSSFPSDSEVEILRANYNFRAISVPKGECTVTFVYKPESFKRGAAISIIALAVLVSLVVYCWLHRRISPR